jgi:hypothetical protein
LHPTLGKTGNNFYSIKKNTKKLFPAYPPKLIHIIFFTATSKLQITTTERTNSQQDTNSTHNNFYPQKREKKKKGRKKDMLSEQPVQRRLSRFFGKILPEAKRGVEILAKTRRA